ncbi:MAG: ribulose-phosphate 3-epimerase [Deltaproteobacteria bacterium]|nr:ribulose-phosphate 3-epimerase [Deltaproteobacteria bacterium]
MSDENPRPVLIAPSILAADIARLGDEVASVERAGADWIHVDVMDGHFVPNISIGPFVTEAVRRSTSLPVDVHLMIEQPERYIADFVKAGADRVGVHVETCPNLHRSIAQIREAGAKACVVVNPGTPASFLEYVIRDVDQVLIMTVNPGFGGQSYIETMREKIETVRGWIDEGNLDVDLQVDGGIAPDTIAHAYAAGANVFVAGTAVFGQQDYAAAIRTLRERAVA